MKIKEISEELKNYFQPFYNQHNVIGMLEDGMAERVIVKMRPGYRAWTPSGTARDCGGYYIIARYSSYDKLEKKTMEITRDVDDK